MSTQVDLHYEFQSIRFDVAGQDIGVALTNGKIGLAGIDAPFGIAITPVADGEWGLVEARCAMNVRADTGIQVPPAANYLQDPKILKALVDRAATLLKTINAWPEDVESNRAARLVLNEKLAPSDVADRVIISFRPKMLYLPMASWDSTWPLIEGRVKADTYFRVNGFSREEVEEAIEPLREIFSGPWVRARYREALKEKEEPTMAADFPPGSRHWFPAYHLARTALGAICIDPGWNYLVEIGLSIRDLHGFKDLHKLTRHLAKSPGTQHHLCLAGELLRRDYLIELEPQGNDLLVTRGKQMYEIEVKEFSSQSPTRRLSRLIERKSNRLSKSPERPVVFHAVLIENGVFEKGKEEKFFREVMGLVEFLPSNISAVVAGRRFVDSAGGRVKRDAEVIVLNPAAFAPSSKEDLAAIFARNYKTIQYPIFGIGSFFYFTNEEAPPEA